MEIETVVDGQIVCGRIVILCKRILAVEMIPAVGEPLQEYGERISPADQGVLYCDDSGEISPRGMAEAKRVLAEQFRRLNR